MNLPEEICSAIPTTDTYSLQQGQDEFYFALPYQQMDVALWCLNHNKPASVLAEELSISKSQAEWVYQDILNKRKTTRYLHANAIKTEEVDIEIR
jgi:NAD+ synthase